MANFVARAFEDLLGAYSDYMDALYLSVDQMKALKDDTVISFHGNRHVMWSELSHEELTVETRPSPLVAELLAEDYLLSIPFGMRGSFDPVALPRANCAAGGAFTMLRHTDHQSENGFSYYHRYDQADFFDRNNALRCERLRELLNGG